MHQVCSACVLGKKWLNVKSWNKFPFRLSYNLSIESVSMLKIQCSVSYKMLMIHLQEKSQDSLSILRRCVCYKIFMNLLKKIKLLTVFYLFSKKVTNSTSEFDTWTFSPGPQRRKYPRQESNSPQMKKRRWKIIYSPFFSAQVETIIIFSSPQSNKNHLQSWALGNISVLTGVFVFSKHVFHETASAQTWLIWFLKKITIAFLKALVIHDVGRSFFPQLFSLETKDKSLFFRFFL